MIRCLLAAFLATIVSLPAAALTDPPDTTAAARDVIAGLNKIVTPHGIQETFEVTLGGTRQVVNVRGADRDNPILIYIHGGPGAVEMPFAWAFQRPWEDYFTVVQWDQRGAGRSFPLNDPKKLAPTMTIDRYRDDAIELIEQLRRKYGKQKVFLLGHSWGSVVGLEVAAKRPDLLYAYIGMGQFIDPAEGERAGFDWTLKQARDDHNDQAVKELQALEPYPGKYESDRIDAERKWAVHYGALFAGRKDADFYYALPDLSPEYTQSDIKAWSNGAQFTIKLVAPLMLKASFRSLDHVDCPVLLFEGRHDQLIPSSVAWLWFQRLRAPSKHFEWFENSGHMMMIEEPGHMLGALIQYARPLAQR